MEHILFLPVAPVWCDKHNFFNLHLVLIQSSLLILNWVLLIMIKTYLLSKSKFVVLTNSFYSCLVATYLGQWNKHFCIKKMVYFTNTGFAYIRYMYELANSNALEARRVG